MGKGRQRASVRPFFEMLGSARCRMIEAVVMDRHSAYEQEVKANCPQAEIVFDLFHVVAKYGREVIDRVRIDEANRLRHDKPARHVIKSARWLLLRNRSNIKRRGDRVRLDELLKANRRLMTVYVLRDELKHLWWFHARGHAHRTKTLYGPAPAAGSDERERIDVPRVGEEHEAGSHQVPRSLLVGIIQPRLEETLELVRSHLEASGFDKIAGRRTVGDML